MSACIRKEQEMSEVKELLINSKIGFLKEWEQHESCYIVLAAEYDQAIAALEDEQKQRARFKRKNYPTAL